ncbi:MAG: hypothetical protein CMO80_02535 [Verrucomicrobiales bacterium]|nr:hypothetical protein [Verrucomicrobiales bacterium]|tara:strand:- start:579 stop:848 length:270 start_codon:yes stop_codon:yes gene_type:complete
MYSRAPESRETQFQFRLPEAKDVNLIGDLMGKRWRRPMERCRDIWETTVDLPMGWFVYAVEIDGRLTWDRDAGKARTADGETCSLACIN